ncbi:MAG: hypothetical protein DMG57_31940 [Acidobacteria bacterium]|nr:MAG: hypothetical protein DMG57_31940 [Acidobacteriota bacterium]
MKRARKGSGYVRRRGRIWYITYSANGVHHEESSHSTKLAAAQKLLRERLAAGSSGPPPRPQEILVNELLDDLAREYQLNHPRSIDDFLRVGLKHVRPYLGGNTAREVTTDALRDYQVQRRAEGAADATINREMALLRRAFNLARRATPPKLTSTPYFPMFKERNVRTGFLESDQYARLLAELPREVKPLLVIAFHVGCRRGELLGRRKLLRPLSWPQVDLLNDQIVLRPGTTKNDEGRILPIYGEMKPWLEMLRHERDQYYPECPWVFHRNGEPIKDFRKGWAEACRRAGLVGLRFHDLRRSAVRSMVRAGIDRKNGRCRFPATRPKRSSSATTSSSSVTWPRLPRS